MGRGVEVDKSSFVRVGKWFKNYVSRYVFESDIDNINIKNKIEHSYRVCTNMTEIFNKIEDSSGYVGGVFLAKTIGLLHDVGRFEQYNKYKTYRDDISENHALMGVGVLMEENIFSKINYLAEYKKYILDAIAQHNSISVNFKEGEINNPYISMIRDADKLDILKTIAEGFSRRGGDESVVLRSLNYKNSNIVSLKVYEDFMSEKVVNVNNVLTITDYKVLILSWVYDLYYGASREIASKNELFYQIVKVLPSGFRFSRIAEKYEEYMSAWCDQDSCAV